MAEPQLIEYIKKAKAAGQDDGQTRSLLLKNGWSEGEIYEAFSALRPDENPIATEAAPAQLEESEPDLKQSLSEDQIMHQVSGQAEIKKPVEAEPVETPVETSNAAADAGEGGQPFQRRSNNAMAVVLKIAIVLVLVGIIGAGAFFATQQSDFLKKAAKKAFSYFTPTVEVDNPELEQNLNPPEQNQQPPSENLPQPEEIGPVLLASVPEDIDASKITSAAFSRDGGTAVFCGPMISDASKISCFSNNQKLFDGPYNIKPYWSGMSPNSQRTVYFYYDQTKRQAFAFENGKEGTRYDGTITYPVFSPDSKNFAYVVIGNDGKYFAVINGQAGVKHDRIFMAPQFSGDGKYLNYGARDGQEILWLADEIK